MSYPNLYKLHKENTLLRKYLKKMIKLGYNLFHLIISGGIRKQKPFLFLNIIFTIFGINSISYENT
jgi:hypothetical protein